MADKQSRKRKSLTQRLKEANAHISKLEAANTNLILNNNRLAVDLNSAQELSNSWQEALIRVIHIFDHEIDQVRFLDFKSLSVDDAMTLAEYVYEKVYNESRSKRNLYNAQARFEALEKLNDRLIDHCLKGLPKTD